MPSPNLKPTSKSLTLFVIIAVVLLFAGLFVYVAGSGKLKAASAELDSKQKEVENSKKIVERLQEAEAKYVQTNAQLQYLEKSVAQQAYVPTLLRQLETYGKDVNLKVASVRPVYKPTPPPTRKLSTDSTNPEAADKQINQSQQGGNDQQKQVEKPKPYDSLEINVDVEGTYNNAMSFLYKITRFPKIVTVNYVQISPVSAMFGTGSPMLQVKLNLTAYVFREESKPAFPGKQPEPAASRAQLNWRLGNEAG